MKKIEMPTHETKNFLEVFEMFVIAAKKDSVPNRYEVLFVCGSIRLECKGKKFGWSISFLRLSSQDPRYWRGYPCPVKQAHPARKEGVP